VAGHKFRLDRHFDGEGDYVLVSVTHDASLTNPYRTGAESGADMLYSNKFTCIPFQLPYRPSFRTPKPFIHGVQNALVTGPPGEEIFTDKYGRVKVQFYWDRQGKKDANSSCWLRVSTYWAGKQWGAMQVPRIGQEVIVAFVEGNPDEPVIVGSVYNPETMPPYGPGKGVISGLKSNTHKGKGYNEMSMDDTAGKEKIIIHAQHDMSSTVEHDHSLTVHNNHQSTVDGTHTETVKKDTKITITEGSYTHTVAANTASHTVNKEILVTSQTAHIHVQAATEIKLEVGASKLLMMSNGNIELTGLNLAIKGAQTVEIQGGSVTSQADADHNTRGAIVLSEASASNTVKGAMVMLNP
jgi:type VI secretion system secreted protein VgrG